MSLGGKKENPIQTQMNNKNGQKSPRSVNSWRYRTPPKEARRGEKGTIFRPLYICPEKMAQGKEKKKKKKGRCPGCSPPPGEKRSNNRHGLRRKRVIKKGRRRRGCCAVEESGPMERGWVHASSADGNGKKRGKKMASLHSPREALYGRT